MRKRPYRDRAEIDAEDLDRSNMMLRDVHDGRSDFYPDRLRIQAQTKFNTEVAEKVAHALLDSDVDPDTRRGLYRAAARQVADHLHRFSSQECTITSRQLIHVEVRDALEAIDFREKIREAVDRWMEDSLDVIVCEITRTAANDVRKELAAAFKSSVTEQLRQDEEE